MSRREQLGKRTLVYGAGSLTAVLLVVGIITLAGLLAERYHYRWDLTPGKTQSLSAVSRALLAQVKQPLTMTAFVAEGRGERQEIRDVLQRYTYVNPQVSFGLVDPEREPLKAKDAGYRFAGNVLLEYEGRRQMADRAEEEAITNALRRVLNPERKTVYFLTGHGERSLDEVGKGGFQAARRALENEGYEVKGLNLLTQAGVPREAAAVVVAAPKKPVLAQELTALKNYLTGGGGLLVLLEAFEDGGLKDFLAGYGVELDDGIILDQNQVSQALGMSAVVPIVIQYGPSPITRDFKNLVTAYPLARPLTLKREAKGAVPLPLATTTDTSWEKRGKEWMKSGTAGFDPKQDRKGPFTLAAQVEIGLAPPKEKAGKAGEAGKPEEARKTYLVVFGDVDFAANTFFNLFSNGDLFLNTVNFLAGETGQIVIRQDRKPQILSLTQSQVWTLLFASLVWAPAVMLAGAVYVFRRRRRARR